MKLTKKQKLQKSIDNNNVRIKNYGLDIKQLRHRNEFLECKLQEEIDAEIENDLLNEACFGIIK